jgi:hypothetical protein
LVPRACLFSRWFCLPLSLFLFFFSPQFT